jgi:hypothetical protein
MPKSQIRVILDPLVTETGARNVFNDKMSTGGRSIKVWGWKQPQYDAAQALLESAGYTVKQVKTPVVQSGMYPRGGSIRLHVF